MRERKVCIEYQIEFVKESADSRKWHLMLNVQTTKPDFTASENTKKLFSVNTEGLKDKGAYLQVDLGHVPKVFHGVDSRLS
jgi:hypothetical protein